MHYTDLDKKPEYKKQVAQILGKINEKYKLPKPDFIGVSKPYHCSDDEADVKHCPILLWNKKYDIGQRDGSRCLALLYMVNRRVKGFEITISSCGDYKETLQYLLKLHHKFNMRYLKV